MLRGVFSSWKAGRLTFLLSIGGAAMSKIHDMEVSMEVLSRSPPPQPSPPPLSAFTFIFY